MSDSKTTKAPVNPIAKYASTANRATIIAVIAVIIAAGAIVLALLHWQTVSTSKAGVTQKLQQMHTAIDNKRVQNLAGIQTLKNQIHQLQQRVQSNQENVSKALKLAYGKRTQRALSEISYLIHLSNLHLNIGHDVNTSQQLLKAAYKRLQQLNDPSLFALKQSMNSDINKLENAPKFDVAKLILQLQSLNQQIQNLPVLPKHFFPKDAPSTQTTLTKTDVKKLPWYKQLWHNLSGLKQLVIVSHTGKSAIPLITPEQQLFLKQNIQSKIMQAQWAVLHHDAKLYQSSLTRVKDWMIKYFHESTETKKVLESVNKLTSINITPKYPDISDSLIAIRHSLTSNIVSTSPPRKTKNAKKTTDKLPKNNPGVEI